MKRITAFLIILSTLFTTAFVCSYAETTPYIEYESGNYYLYSDNGIKSGEITVDDKKKEITDLSSKINLTPYLTDATNNATIEIRTAEDKYKINVPMLYGGGDGSFAMPYLIYTKEQFANIEKNPQAYFKLMNDLEGITTPIEIFKGSFDGNNHQISVEINEPNSENVGLFRILDGEFCIKNLKVCGSVKGKKNVGSIAGQLTGDANAKSIIKNCENYAQIYSVAGSCGGIAGISNNSGNVAKTSLTNNINYGNVTSSSGSWTGGISGIISGTVLRCSNFGNISGGNYTGGIAGILYGKISLSSNHGEIIAVVDGINAGGIAGAARSEAAEILNSYNTGDILGSDTSLLSGITNGYPTSAGGININCCYNTGNAIYPLCYKNPNIPDDSVTVYRSYYLADIKKGNYGQNLTSDEMKKIENFVGFINTVWEISDEYPYPQLKGANTNNMLSYELLPGVYKFSPLSVCQPITCVTMEYKGKNLFFASSKGSPAVFNVYNLDDNKLIASFPMPKTRSPWKHLVAPDNTVYVVADRILFRYFPDTNEFKNYGYYDATQTATYGMCMDDEGILYIGTYPGCKITKFDPKTETFTDLGVLDSELSYARSLEYVNGYIYVVCFGNQKNRLIKFNPYNPSDKRSFEYQSVEGYYDANNIYWAYTITEAEDLLLIFTYFNGGGPFLVTFDTKTDSFIDVGMRDRFKGGYATPVLNGKTYLIGGGGSVYELDIASQKVKRLDFNVATTDEFNGGGWVKLKDKPDFPGYTLVTISNDEGDGGCPVLINFETKKRELLKDVELDGGAISIHTMEKGPNGEIYTAGYMGIQSTIYTPETDEYRKIPMGQAEGMQEMNGKMYFGVYDGGEFFEYDPIQPKSKTNPVLLGKVHGSRPFAMEPVGNRMYLGSIPGYGKLDGYLSYYDFDAKKIVDIGNIITNQSVMSLKYHNGYLYGSTTIFGGNSIDATEKEPKIFKFDTEKNVVVDSFTPDLKDVDQYNWIGSINVDKNGTMWGISGYTLFAFDFEEKKVIKQYNFGNYTYAGRVWKPVKMRFDKDGILFVSVNGLKAVNVDTWEVMDLSHLTSVTPSTYEFDNLGNFYYAAGNSGDLHILYRSEFEKNIEDINAARNYFNDKIGLKINTPYMITKGTPVMVDRANKSQVPFIHNNRTYLPLRAISEALGATVSYNDTTGLITIKNDSTVLTLESHSPKITVNDKQMLLTNKPIIKEGRTYLPLRELASLFNLQLNWHDNGTIILSDTSVNISDDFRNTLNTYFAYYLESDYIISQQ